MEEANFLTKFARRVTVIHRRSELRASRIMQDRARANPKIAFLFDTEVLDVLGTTEVSGIQVRHSPTGKEQDVALQGVFLAIGHDPATEVFRGHVDLDAHGYVACRDLTHTSVPGSSRPGMCTITGIAKRSRRPAWAAWRRSMSRSISRSTLRRTA